MRTYLLTANPWLVGPTGGLIFGAAFAGLAHFTPPTSAPWQVAAIPGAVAGALFGGALAYHCVRERRDLRTAAGDLPPAQQLEALRAAGRGQIPADPRVRGSDRPT